jgi:outer membrane protein TolC
MKLLVRNAENEILKANREISVAKVVLKYVMGYSLEKEITLSDQLDKFVEPLISPVSAGFDFSKHIDYRLAQTNFQVSEKLLNLQKAAYLPRLSGFYSYSKTAYGNSANLFKPEVSWYPSSLVGLQISVPVFNSGQKMFRVQQARIDMDKADNQRKLAELTLQKDYLTAVSELESAVEKLKNDLENRKLAEKILEKTKIKFNNGISSSTELSQIENQYIQSYGAFIGSTLQLLQSGLKLSKARGEL